VRAHFPTGFPFMSYLGAHQLVGFGWYALGYALHDFTALTQAADLQDRETPSGPIEEGVSARERLGDALLAANRAPDALREFKRALDLHPRRARVLLGCARAATKANDASAAGYWSDLAKVWSNADADTPGYDEVRHAVAAR